MTVRREALFTCTYRSRDQKITFVVRAWNEDQALAEFQRELGRPGDELGGRITVKRGQVRSTQRRRQRVLRSPRLDRSSAPTAGRGS